MIRSTLYTFAKTLQAPPLKLSQSKFFALCISKIPSPPASRLCWIFVPNMQTCSLPTNGLTVLVEPLREAEACEP
jgi:hypothetical protein